MEKVTALTKKKSGKNAIGVVIQVKLWIIQHHAV